VPALMGPYEAKYRPAVLQSYPVAGGIVVYKGALVGVNASGYLRPMSHATSGLLFVGIAEETVDNSAGQNGERRCNVAKSGSAVYADSAGATQADIGKTVNVFSDNEVQVGSLGLTNVYAVGTLLALEPTSTGANGLRVRIDLKVN